MTPGRGRHSSARASPAPHNAETRFDEPLHDGVLGRALRQAEIAGLVTRNAARLARPPRVPQTEMHTLDATQARALIEAAKDDRLSALYALALASGAREGELLAMRWSDVDWSRGPFASAARCCA